MLKYIEVTPKGYMLNSTLIKGALARKKRFIIDLDEKTLEILPEYCCEVDGKLAPDTFKGAWSLSKDEAYTIKRSLNQPDIYVPSAYQCHQAKFDRKAYIEKCYKGELDSSMIVVENIPLSCILPSDLVLCRSRLYALYDKNDSYLDIQEGGLDVFQGYTVWSDIVKDLEGSKLELTPPPLDPPVVWVTYPGSSYGKVALPKSLNSVIKYMSQQPVIGTMVHNSEGLRKIYTGDLAAVLSPFGFEHKTLVLLTAQGTRLGVYPVAGAIAKCITRGKILAFGVDGVYQPISHPSSTEKSLSQILEAVQAP